MHVVRGDRPSSVQSLPQELKILELVLYLRLNSLQSEGFLSCIHLDYGSREGVLEGHDRKSFVCFG